MQGLIKRQFIHMVQAPAGRHPLSQARYRNALRAQKIPQVTRRGLTLHITPHGQDHLLHG